MAGIITDRKKWEEHNKRLLKGKTYKGKLDGSQETKLFHDAFDDVILPEIVKEGVFQKLYGMMPVQDQRPTKVIFSGDMTICWFKDGSKEMVKCLDFDEFDAEKGVAMCIAKHIFGSRNQFKKFVETEYDKSIDHNVEKAMRRIHKQRTKELEAKMKRSTEIVFTTDSITVRESKTGTGDESDGNTD